MKFLSLTLVMLAASLVSGCASDNVVVRVAEISDVDERMLKREPGRLCLKEAPEYTVDDLDDARLCERAGRLRARGRLHALQDAVKRRQAVQQKAVRAGQ
jgi:hypothetical protein